MVVVAFVHGQASLYRSHVKVCGLLRTVALGNEQQLQSLLLNAFTKGGIHVHILLFSHSL